MTLTILSLIIATIMPHTGVYWKQYRNQMPEYHKHDMREHVIVDMDWIKIN